MWIGRFGLIEFKVWLFVCIVDFRLVVGFGSCVVFGVFSCSWLLGFDCVVVLV